MSKVAVIINDDGTIGILHPGKNTELTFEQICEKDIPDGATYHIIDSSEIPKDRTFRNAWKWQ